MATLVSAITAWQGFCAHVPVPNVEPLPDQRTFPMDMGINLVGQVEKENGVVKNTDDLDTALLENGFVVTKTPIKKNQILRTDWDSEADHTARVYHAGKSISPEVGYVKTRSNRKQRGNVK